MAPDATDLNIASSDQLGDLVPQVAGFLATLVLSVGLETWVFVGVGLGPVAALGSATALYSLLLAMLGPTLRWRLHGYFPVRSVVCWTPRALAVWFSVHSTLVSLSWTSPTLSFAIGGLSFVPGVWIGRRSLNEFLASSTVGLARLHDPTDAQTMIAICERRLADSKLKPAQRPQMKVNLAHALISDSSLQGHHDGLRKATKLLTQVVTDDEGDPEIVFRAALELLRAMAARDFKHDDSRGWLEAVDVWARAAWRCDQGPEAMAIGLLAAAMHESALAERVDIDDDAFAWHRAAAIDRCREALRWAPPDSATLDDVKVELGYLLRSIGATAAELDEAVALGRSLVDQAVRDRSGVRGPDAELAADAELDAEVALAVSLLRRSQELGPTLEADTDEAIGLCVAALAGQRPRPHAARALAEALAIRALVGRPITASVPGGGQIDAAAAFRRAFATERERSDRHGHEMAMIWAEWAMEVGAIEDAAEALWQIVTLLPEESIRRHELSSRHRLVGSLQGVATEAGFWLARAGRVREAVVAAEHGRAVLSTARLQPDDPDLQAQLSAVRRPELWWRWEQATTRLAAVHRSQHAGPSARVDEATSPFESPEHALWTEREHVIEEIAAVLGERPDAMLPPYESLRRRIGEDIVVYLGSASRGGFALIVGPGYEPIHVELPALTAETVEERVVALLQTSGMSTGTWPSTLADTVAWLASAADLPALLATLPADDATRDVVLVPLGLLGLLPVHAVTLAAVPPVVVRYAPNARAATTARAVAARLSSSLPRLLAVAAPDVAGQAALPGAAAEVGRLAGLYGSACWLLADAAKADVLRLMSGASVWHFACHGEVNLADPAESAVVLRDGRLTVREIKTRLRGEHRLAVLSACETATPDLDLLDEVTSLAGSLLEAGVAGVVASQWKVDDTAAALLVLSFHERLRRGCPPAQALAGAQLWLRTATNHALHAAFPQLVVPPPGLPEAAEAEWSRRRPYEHPKHWAAFSFTGV